MKEQITALIENLTLATKNGQLVWNETGPKEKRDWYREFVTSGEDGTEYETEIKYFLSGDKWQLDTSSHIWVKNDKLPNGRLFVSGLTYDIQDLRNEIMNKFCQDMKPTTKIIEDILVDITKSVSTSTFRDSRINNVLDSKNN